MSYHLQPDGRYPGLSGVTVALNRRSVDAYEIATTVGAYLEANHAPRPAALPSGKILACTLCDVPHTTTVPWDMKRWPYCSAHVPTIDNGRATVERQIKQGAYAIQAAKDYTKQWKIENKTLVAASKAIAKVAATAKPRKATPAAKAPARKARHVAAKPGQPHAADCFCHVIPAGYRHQLIEMLFTVVKQATERQEEVA